MSIITAACTSSAGLSSSGYPRAPVSRFDYLLLRLIFLFFLFSPPPRSFCAGSDELICAHHHVWILRAQCTGASPVPVSLVEALFNRAAAAAVCIRSGLGHSGHSKPMRISPVAQLHGSGVYVIISFSVWAFLCAKVFIGRKESRRKMPQVRSINCTIS